MVRPFWPHDLLPSLGSNAGKKPNARSGWSPSLLGLDGELWSTLSLICHPSLCEQESKFSPRDQAQERKKAPGHTATAVLILTQHLMSHVFMPVTMQSRRPRAVLGKITCCAKAASFPHKENSRLLKTDVELKNVSRTKHKPVAFQQCYEPIPCFITVFHTFKRGSRTPEIIVPQSCLEPSHTTWQASGQ